MRLLAGLVLALFAAVQVLPALHHALVHHVVCPEHGELVHGSAASHEHAEDVPNPGLTFRAGQVELAHEHCGLPAGVREPVASPREALEIPGGDVGLRAASAIECSSSKTSVELLALAPKQSPPLPLS